MPTRPLAAVILTLAAFALATATAGEAGATRVAKWKDDKAGAFMLMFDDSAPTDVKNAIPELTKRHLIGTFYINPGAGHYLAFKDAWEKQIPATGMEYANHTFTHNGASDVANGEEEVGKCNEAIMRIIPGAQPRLISFGRPGVKAGAWKLTDEQLAQILAKNHLIDPNPLARHFAMIDLKTPDDIFKVAEQAAAKGEASDVIFHGVGGDWLTFSMPDYIAALDQLVTLRDKLWFGGAIAVYKYQVERDGAQAQVQSADAKEIRVALRTTADTALFDAPLTLVTQVPASWQHCRVVQGAAKSEVAAVDGVLRYDALPDGKPIVIQPLK